MEIVNINDLLIKNLIEEGMDSREAKKIVDFFIFNHTVEQLKEMTLEEEDFGFSGDWWKQ